MGNPNDVDRAEESRTMAVYAAMIDRLDQNVGKILDKLDSQGKLENINHFCPHNGGSISKLRGWNRSNWYINQLESLGAGQMWYIL